MRSGVLPATQAGLGSLSRAPIPIPPEPVPCGRVPATPARPSSGGTVLLAGASRVARRMVASLLLGDAGGSVADVVGDADGSVGEAWVVYRHGLGTLAYQPGRRTPAPLGADQPTGTRVGQPTGTRRAAVRPPRRIEVGAPARFLESVTIIDPPSPDRLGSDAVLEAAANAVGVLWVIDIAEAPSRLELDLSTRLAKDAGRVAVALVRTGEVRRGRSALAGLRAALRLYGPPLANASWYPLAEPAGVHDLRELLATWGAYAQPPVVVGSVPVVAEDERWRAVLDESVAECRESMIGRLSADVVAAQQRCTEVLRTRGVSDLPYVLDRELSALSVRAGRGLESDADHLAELLCAALLDPGAVVAGRHRVRAAIRRTVAAIEPDDRDPHLALLLTSTGGVAAMRGRRALDALLGVRLDDQPVGVFPPVGVALAASCYARWTDPGTPSADTSARGMDPTLAAGRTPAADPAAGDRWLRQALPAVETAVAGELVRRLAILHQALSIVATDAVDHGVLLA